MLEVEWRAAAALVELPTPHHGPMAGYAHRSADATGTADPLEANLLLLENIAGGRVLWISIDSVAVPGDLRAAIVTSVAAATDLGPEEVICAASHTHAAPAGWVGTIHPALPADQDLSAIRAVADTIADTAAGLVPVPTSLTWAQGLVAGVGSNRHHPDGPTDQSAGVLVVGAPEGPVAVLFDYACHPTVLGPDNLLLSADWVGATRTHLRRNLSPELPVVFLQGCAGDQSTRFHRQVQSVDELHRLGALVGEAILAALPGTPVDPGAIVLQREDVTLTTRSPDDHDLHTAGPTEVPDDRVGPDDARRLMASLSEGRRARLATIDADLPAEMVLPLSLVRVGDRQWLHTSVELYSAAGQRIRRAAPTARVIGYADGYHSYLADPTTVETNQYEAMSSYFDPEQTERFVTRCLDLIRTRSNQGMSA